MMTKRNILPHNKLQKPKKNIKTRPKTKKRWRINKLERNIRKIVSIAVAKL